MSVLRFRHRSSHYLSQFPTEYVCPKCGHFNASKRARKAGANLPMTPVSPQSAAIQSGVQSVPSASGPERQPAPGSQSASTPREPSPKSPLSASTVLVEKHDAGHEDGPQDKADARVGDAAADTTTHMEVDP